MIVGSQENLSEDSLYEDSEILDGENSEEEI
jgi:hypothetical protein